MGDISGEFWKELNDIHSKFWNGVNRKCASLAVYKHIDYYEIGGNGFKTFPPIQTLAQPYFIVN